MNLNCMRGVEVRRHTVIEARMNKKGGSYNVLLLS